MLRQVHVIKNCYKLEQTSIRLAEDLLMKNNGIDNDIAIAGSTKMI